jgi:hypothetical protein
VRALRLSIVGRDEADDPLSLAIKVVNAYLNMIDGRQKDPQGNAFDEKTVFGDQRCEKEINARYAECLLNEKWVKRGQFLNKVFIKHLRKIKICLNSTEANYHYHHVSCIFIAEHELTIEESEWCLDHHMPKAQGQEYLSRRPRSGSIASSRSSSSFAATTASPAAAASADSQQHRRFQLSMNGRQDRPCACVCSLSLPLARVSPRVRAGVCVCSPRPRAGYIFLLRGSGRRPFLVARDRGGPFVPAAADSLARQRPRTRCAVTPLNALVIETWRRGVTQQPMPTHDLVS